MQGTTTAPKDTPSGDLQITIRNCNSIGSATLSLRPGSLNIKYGPNGIGKSTIARALTLRVDQAQLDELTPFKHRGVDSGSRPSVEGADGIERVLTFSDRYVSQFVFQRDEVLKDSFEIFINTDEYRAGNQHIEGLFEVLKTTFVDQPEFSAAVKSFTELRDAFSVTKSGAVAKTSRGYKALSMAGKLTNIPSELRGFSHFLHSEDPAGWISWQSKGKAFLELSDNCPFCSGDSLDKQTASRVSAEYESSAVKNMSALRGVIRDLGRYFEPSSLEQLEKLTTSITEVTPEQALFLATLRQQVETLLSKLTALQALSFPSLRNEENVAATLGELKIELPLLHALDSEATRSVVGLINEKLDEVTAQIDEIRREIGRQKSRVARLIEKNQESINNFLRSAGYRYRVRIEPQEDSYRMLLEHFDAAGHLETASEHLSYGERNAFALVLFMHHVQREKPDLVVLDDPVSSFDKTKKFAILHQLFRGATSLRDVTTLLLTHDLEPAIDVVRTGASRHFIAARPAVHFLSGRNGTVSEKLVEAKDISTFTHVCQTNVRESSEPLVKLIYLRRLFEVQGEKGAAYDLLSSLLHLRPEPTKRSEDAAHSHVALTEDEIVEATRQIQRYVPDFDYALLLAEARRPGAIESMFHSTSVGYEKVQLFRVLIELHPATLRGDDVFVKFVNETYHIENEYLMQLNPRQFDAVPEFVIAECIKLVSHLPATL